VRFEGTLEIAAPRARVWEFLTDPRQVSACGPDVQSLEVTDAERFKVVVRAGVGPIKGTFRFDVRFAELREPEFAAIEARGQMPGSAVEMRNTMTLEDGGAETTMRWASDVNVMGMIASVGARLMQGAADKTTKQVFACIKAKLETPAATGAAAGG
jgi:carbon monoxide dehydrogenase subunit G